MPAASKVRTAASAFCHSDAEPGDCTTSPRPMTSSAFTIVRLRLLEQILDRDQWTNIEPELNLANAGMMNLPISTLCSGMLPFDSEGEFVRKALPPVDSSLTQVRKQIGPTPSAMSDGPFPPLLGSSLSVSVENLCPSSISFFTAT